MTPRWILGKDGKYRDKSRNVRCPHGLARPFCKECGGSQICEHDRARFRCRECGGGGTCEHNSQRPQCSRCDPSSVYKRYQKGAKYRKISFNLSLEDFKEVVSSSCKYCNESIKPITCDRIDSNKGYSFSNCQALCDMCNRMKFNFIEEDFKCHIVKIIRFNPNWESYERS